jgi:transposase
MYNADPLSLPAALQHCKRRFDRRPILRQSGCEGLDGRITAWRITAVAVETFAPPMETIRCGRDFAAWLGLVPLQHSTGGKQRLGRTSKMGQRDIRRLLIIGAMAVLQAAGRFAPPEGSWLARMLARKPRMLVAIALANKMARGIWAMLTKKQDYRDPVAATA